MSSVMALSGVEHLDDCRLSQVGRVLLWEIVRSYMYN